jgi:hypothetical protein
MRSRGAASGPVSRNTRECGHAGRGGAGGDEADVSARLIATKLTERWGRAVFVENKPGDAGAAGAEFVAQAKPDGHVLLMGNVVTQAILPALLKKIPTTRTVRSRRCRSSAKCRSCCWCTRRSRRRRRAILSRRRNRKLRLSSTPAPATAA